MRYAGVSNNIVIIVDEYNTQMSFPPTADGVEVLTVEVGDGELVSVGMTYTEDEGFSGEYRPPKPTQLDRIETQLDDADTIQAELLFNQANADVDTQLILETLAEILLNQQGV